MYQSTCFLYIFVLCRTNYLGQTACVHLVSWGNFAKKAQVHVTAPLA